MKQYSKWKDRFKLLGGARILSGLVFFLILVPIISTSQTALSAGDLAIIAVNPSGTDAFVFVLVRDIEINTVINFTDNGFASTTSGRTGEGFLIYTAPSAQIAGTVITWSNG